MILNQGLLKTKLKSTKSLLQLIVLEIMGDVYCK